VRYEWRLAAQAGINALLYQARQGDGNLWNPTSFALAQNGPDVRTSRWTKSELTPAQERVGQAIAGHKMPSLAIDAYQHIWLLCQERSTRAWNLFQSEDQLRTFTQVAQPWPAPYRVASLAIGMTGEFYSTARRHDGAGGFELWFRRSLDGEDWSSPPVLIGPVTARFNPTVFQCVEQQSFEILATDIDTHIYSSLDAGRTWSLCPMEFSAPGESHIWQNGTPSGFLEWGLATVIHTPQGNLQSLAQAIRSDGIAEVARTATRQPDGTFSWATPYIWGTGGAILGPLLQTLVSLAPFAEYRRAVADGYRYPFSISQGPSL
jgi:hypothetical protein